MKMPPELRRKLARYWDVLLIIVGQIVALLASDPDAREYLAQFGGWVTTGIGIVNILLNRLPKANEPAADAESPKE